MAVTFPSPEEIARALLRRLDVKAPANLFEVTQACTLRIREEMSKGFDGALIYKPNKRRGAIIVRADIRELGRKRFTIAHEIGHYALYPLPGHGLSMAACKDEQINSWGGNSGRREAEANRFASELLLPAEQIIPIIKANSVDIETARAISNDFQTSLTAAARKCVELADESCAFVVSVDGVVRHCKASKSWRYQMPVGCELGYGTLARRLATGDGTRHERMEINALAWVMSQGTDPRGADLIEDSILLPNYNTVLSILTAVGQ